MPKRTNAFQELVAIIHSKISSSGQVTESLLMRDSITSEMREVDVVIKSTVANYDVYISVECRDHNRPADVTWIESMAKKHESLATSVLVLWSRSGFTKQALVKAKALKIDTVSQKTANNADWAKLARSFIGSHVQLVKPGFTPFIDVKPLGRESLRLEDITTLLFYDMQGNVVCSVTQILEVLQNSNDVRKTLLDHALIGLGDFYVEIRPPIPWFTDTSEGERVPVLRVGVSVATVTEKLLLETSSAAFEGKVATLAAADALEGRIQFYVEESPDGSTPIINATLRRK